jgi:uracil-DNA glycosylase
MVAELDLVRPVGLVVLGATAGKALYGRNFRVGETRGTRQEFPDVMPGGGAPRHRPAWVLPTVHPSAVLRSRDRDVDYAAFVEDLKVAASLLGPR